MDDQRRSCEEFDKMDHEGDMLPGFRFHPTDEELVGFYLKKKIQHHVLPNEIIKQVDIYKYDPWDLPSLAPLGEKEWYFYCPRDRKYKNSARPNRVTGAGFWKATGTDRPIYSSSGAKCIGLKKSLVFYRGRGAKAIKTDWMMHEFRLPSAVEQPEENKKIQLKNLHPNDAWAICRIFKKTNPIGQRSVSHSWVSLSSQDTTTPELLSNSSQFSPDNNISCMTNNHLCYTIKSTSSLPYMDFGTNNEFMFSSATHTVVSEPLVLNLDGEFGGELQQQQPSFYNFPMSRGPENELGSVATGGFTFGLPATVAAATADEWRVNMGWDSPPSHSASTTYSSLA